MFQIAYCEFFSVQLSEDWKAICCSFIDVVKTHMASLLNNPKTHLILHLVDCMKDFGPSSAFSAERKTVLFNRTYTYIGPIIGLSLLTRGFVNIMFLETGELQVEI